MNDPEVRIELRRDDSTGALQVVITYLGLTADDAKEIASRIDTLLGLEQKADQ